MDSNTTRGTKRKRYEPTEEPISTRIAGKLHHQVKEVHKASKTAKAQETQKVVKRLKDIRKKDPSDAGIEGFEAELTTLKEIDHDAVGNSAFKTKILKDHTLKSNEDVTNAMTKEFANHFLVPAEPGTTLAKIQSRLLSSKILATQISASVDSLKILLNPALKQTLLASTSASTANAADSVEQSSSSSRPAKSLKSSASSSAPAGASNKAAVQKSAKNDDDDDEGMYEDANEDDDDDVGGESDSSRDFGGWESGSVDGEGAAGDDDGWESGSVGSAAGLYHSGDEDEGEDSDEDENDSESDNEDLKPKPKRAKTQSAKAPATKAMAKPTAKSTAKSTKTKTTPSSSNNKMESTFLPSLAVGFVRGSDDSDFSDTEAQDADMPKKNRRGQRARRLIWEKKFGRNANHKKKEAELAAAQAAKSKNSGHTSSKIRSGSNAISAVPGASASTASTAARGTAAGWGTAAARGPPATGKGFARGGGGDRAPQPLQGKGNGKYTTTTATTPVDAGWGGRSAGVPAPAAPSRPGRGPPTKADEKPLHPSWEAKRKLKEKESAGIVPSQGVKIKFS